MNLQKYEEFIEFAKHLNFSNAAKVLHISQSTLSKHIAELEREVGFELISRNTNSNLTPAGRHFLETVEKMLFMYKDALEECRQLNDNRVGSITIQDPIMDATIAYQSVAVASYFFANYPDIELKLHPVSGELSLDALMNNRIDIGYYFGYGPHAPRISSFAEKGFCIFPLRYRRFHAWMNREHKLAKKDKLTFYDLKGCPILLPANKLFENWRKVIEEAALAHGFKPIINLKITPTISGYFMIDTKEGVIVLNEALGQDPRFLMRQDMVTKSFDDPDLGYTMYAIYRKDHTSPILPLYIEQLQALSKQEYFPEEVLA